MEPEQIHRWQIRRLIAGTILHIALCIFVLSISWEFSRLTVETGDWRQLLWLIPALGLLAAGHKLSTIHSERVTWKAIDMLHEWYFRKQAE